MIIKETLVQFVFEEVKLLFIKEWDKNTHQIKSGQRELKFFIDTLDDGIAKARERLFIARSERLKYQEQTDSYRNELQAVIDNYVREQQDKAYMHGKKVQLTKEDIFHSFDSNKLELYDNSKKFTLRMNSIEERIKTIITHLSQLEEFQILAQNTLYETETTNDIILIATKLRDIRLDSLDKMARSLAAGMDKSLQLFERINDKLSSLDTTGAMKDFNSVVRYDDPFMNSFIGQYDAFKEPVLETA